MIAAFLQFNDNVEECHLSAAFPQKSVTVQNCLNPLGNAHLSRTFGAFIQGVNISR